MKNAKSSLKIKSPFFRQIFFSFVLATAILAALFTFFITAVYNNAIKNTVYRFNQKLLAQSTYSVQYIDELAQRLADSLNQDRNVIGFLYTENPSPKQMIYLNQTIQKEIFPLTYINSVYLYNANQDLVYSSKTGEQSTSDGFYNQTLMNLLKNPNQLRELQWRPFANNTHNGDDSPNVCSYILPVWKPDSEDLRSALVINISVESLINSIQSINKTESGFDTQFLVVNQEGQVLGTPPAKEQDITNALVKHEKQNQSTLLPEIHNLIKTKNTSYFTYKVDGESYLIMHNELNQNDWTLVGIFLERDLFQDVSKTSFLSLGILFILFFACILFGLENAKRISQPIQNISQKIKESFSSSYAKNPEIMTEIEVIQSVFQNIEEQNKRFETLRQESNYALQQELLSGLVSGNNVRTMSKVNEGLEFLGLEFVYMSPLRIVILQIDDYKNFEIAYNPKERWAYRYAISNLITEVASEEVESVVFSQDSDKFVILVNNTKLKTNNPTHVLEVLIKKIQSDLLKHLELSISVAYSEPFYDLVHISREYANLTELLQLRIKYGYCSILSPNLFGELEYDPLEVPLQKETALYLAINKADKQQALNLLQELLEIILPYSYDEIMYYVNHLGYKINEEVVNKNIDSRIEIHEIFQQFITAVSFAEVLSQIQMLFEKYIDQLCIIVSQKQETKNNLQIMTSRIIEIIEEQYTDSNLSLNTIALQLNLSPKYIGRIFRETTGTAVSRYLLEFRLNLVGESIKTQEYDGATTLENVGLEFNNYFYTCFKNHFGITLNEYRAQYPDKDAIQ